MIAVAATVASMRALIKKAEKEISRARKENDIIDQRIKHLKTAYSELGKAIDQANATVHKVERHNMPGEWKGRIFGRFKRNCNQDIPEWLNSITKANKAARREIRNEVIRLELQKRSWANQIAKATRGIESWMRELKKLQSAQKTR